MKNEEILNTLNDAQRAAVCYNDGPHLVIAGAGSGKTRVLTYKIAYMLASGVAPSSILALTFTNKAAREMKDRIASLVGQKVARYVAAGTFHSVFARILRQESDKLGFSADYTIYDTTDSKSVIKAIIKEMDLDEKTYKAGDVLARISDAKNRMLSPRDYVSNKALMERDNMERRYRLCDVYHYYQNRLRTANAMDFDDILFNMNVLLEKFPDVLDRYQEVFRYILVDEYQDTNYSQYCIIRKLAAKYRNICVVGDDAQSIYSFRGADIRNILQFQREYEGCPVFKLERNYRSTQNIVNAANSLIRQNQNQIPKNVYSENGVGMPLQMSSYESDREEGKFIADKLMFLHKGSRSYDDMAVLYRTNAQSRVIEDELRKLNIPYRIYGSVSFYQRKEIKDVLSYFRLIVNPQDDEALLRVINFPSRGIGETTMKRVRELAHGSNLSMMEVVSHPADYGLAVNAATQKKLQQFALIISQFQKDVDEMDAYSFAQLVVKQTGIKAALSIKSHESEEDLDRAENIDELLSAIREYVTVEQQANPETPLEALNIRGFLAEVALLTDQDTHQQDDTPRVTLMTIHAAKGLEYGVVMIAGLEENLFPSMYCDRPSELEEERRLLYVAITRAKEECYITSARTRFRNGQLQYPEPSRFLKEIDPRFVQRMQESARRPAWSSFDRGFSFIPEMPQPFERRETSATSHRSLKATTGMQVKTGKTPIPSPYPVGSRVRHAVFGDGTVKEAYLENGNQKISIDFDRLGLKTMLISFVKLEQL